MIVKQILLVGTLRNVQRKVWRICILMLDIYVDQLNACKISPSSFTFNIYIYLFRSFDFRLDINCWVTSIANLKEKQTINSTSYKEQLSHLLPVVIRKEFLIHFNKFSSRGVLRREWQISYTIKITFLTCNIKFSELKLQDRNIWPIMQRYQQVVLVSIAFL